MVGGTTAGEISTSGFSTESVVIMALSSHTLKFVTGIGMNMRQDETACGTALAHEINHKIPMKEALSLLIFPDGMVVPGYKSADRIIEFLDNIKE